MWTLHISHHCLQMSINFVLHEMISFTAHIQAEYSSFVELQQWLPLAPLAKYYFKVDAVLVEIKPRCLR